MSRSNGPALGRDQLLRVLALPTEATNAEIQTASARLQGWLEARRASLPPDAAGPRAALDRELADLLESTACWTTPPATPAGAAPATRPRIPGPAAAAIASLALLALLLAWAAGFRVHRKPGLEPAPIYAAPAQLLLEGDLAGARLRIYDADRSELIDQREAAAARLELEPGRYAIEVSRADCPEPWTRSVFLEPDRLHRFAPEVCAGKGSLVVRSTPALGRLRIDELDVGQTGDRVHPLGVGDHRVRVDKAGFRPFEAQVRIAPGETVALAPDLVALAEGESAGRPLPVARLAPSVAPPDARSIQGFSEAELKNDFKLPPLEKPSVGLPRRSDFLDRDGLPAMPDGGSTAWHDRVAKDLRERFDRDGSGAIDRLEESEAIHCTIWREIEADFDRGGLGLSLAHYYGFDGSDWHPGALAVARAHRSAVYAKMRECGLQP